MNTGLIIYILVCVGITIGRLQTIDHSFSMWTMIKFVILSPIAIPVLIGSIITLIAEYANQRLNEINNNNNNN